MSRVDRDRLIELATAIADKYDCTLVAIPGQPVIIRGGAAQIRHTLNDWSAVSGDDALSAAIEAIGGGRDQ